MERKEFNTFVKEFLTLVRSCAGKKAVKVSDNTFRNGEGFIQLEYDVTKIDGSIDLEWDVDCDRKLSELFLKWGVDNSWWFGNRIGCKINDE